MVKISGVVNSGYLGTFGSYWGRFGTNVSRKAAFVSRRSLLHPGSGVDVCLPPPRALALSALMEERLEIIEMFLDNFFQHN